MRVTCGLCEPECVDSPDSQETNISTFNTSFDPTVISMKFMSLVQHDLSAIWSDLSQSFPLLWASDLFSKEQIGILSSIQKDIRLNIFQYILGLDERWSLEDTRSISCFTMTCLVWMKMVEGLAHWDTKFKPSQHINLVSSYFKTLMVIYLDIICVVQIIHWIPSFLSYFLKWKFSHSRSKLFCDLDIILISP